MKLTHRPTALLVAIVVISLIGAVTLGAAGAVAQTQSQSQYENVSESASDAADTAEEVTNSSSNENTDNSGSSDEDADNGDGDTDSGSTTDAEPGESIQLDDSVVIDSYQYNTQEKTLTVKISNRGDDDARVLLAEVIEKGAEGMEFRDFALSSGETRELVLRDIDDQAGDPAVMAATQQSLENRRIEWIPTGEDPLSETVSLTQGLGIGITTMTLMTGIMAYRKTSKSGDEPEDPFEDKVFR